MKPYLLFSLLFSVTSSILFGCASKPIGTAELKPNEGIVFGKVESIEYNGVETKDPICWMTYGESGLEASPGGIFEKAVPLVTGSFFVFVREQGRRQTKRMTCRLRLNALVDSTVLSEISIMYNVVPGTISYLGRLKLRAALASSLNNTLRSLYSPIPVEMDGNLSIQLEDYFKEDTDAFMNQQATLKKYRVDNSVPSQIIVSDPAVTSSWK